MERNQISFSAQEIELLSSLKDELGSDANEVICRILRTGSVPSAPLSENEALVLQDALHDLLVVRGLDENYELTSQGNEIEALIFKLVPT